MGAGGNLWSATLAQLRLTAQARDLRETTKFRVASCDVQGEYTGIGHGDVLS